VGRSQGHIVEVILVILARRDGLLLERRSVVGRNVGMTWLLLLLLLLLLVPCWCLPFVGVVEVLVEETGSSSE
jgi:hypothetical protein